MKPALILLFLATFFFLSCKKKNSTDANNTNLNCGPFTPNPELSAPADVAGTTMQIDSIPLAVGNQWTYQLREQSFDYCGLIYFDSIVYTVTVISDTVLNGMRFALMESSYNNTTNAHTGYPFFPSTYFCYPLASYYFVNFSNGLHELATLANTDSAYIADSTAYLIRSTSNYYSWNSAEYTSANDTLVQRSWSGYVTVTTPAGTFNCRKILVTDTSNKNYCGSPVTAPYPGIISSQYFSSKGLVQEIQTGYGAISAGPGQGLPIITRVVTLTAVNF